MTTSGAWTEDELARYGDATEIEVSSRRADGSLRPYVTIWLVRVGPDLYIRSAHGPDNPWYRRAVASGTGRIRAGNLEQDVIFTQAGRGVQADVDSVYHAKYDRYGPALVDPVVGKQAAEVTLRLLPARA